MLYGEGPAQAGNRAEPDILPGIIIMGENEGNLESLLEELLDADSAHVVIGEYNALINRSS
jgi:hypothetical protein